MPDVGQPLGDRLERGVAHGRAGPVAEDEQVGRALGPDQQGRDLALLRRGEELQLLLDHHRASFVVPSVLTLAGRSIDWLIP